MRRIYPYLFSLLVIASLAGCDSGSDGEDVPDSERFVGNWTIASVRDEEGDKTALVTALGQMSAAFDADGTYELTFDPAGSGAPNQTFGETYTVNELTKLIVLNATAQGTTIPLSISYDFEDDDEVVLTIPEVAVALVAFGGFEAFGDLVGDVRLTLRKVN